MTKLDSPLRAALSYLAWPLLYGFGLCGAGAAFASDRPLLWFNMMYLCMVVIIAIGERWLPYENRWLENDGETFSDLAHTLLTKGLAQLGVAAANTLAISTALIAQPSFSVSSMLWPNSWPLPAQVVLGLVVAELGLYVAHRMAHTHEALWRFHALHHSVTRLWVLNTGRFHLVDSCWKVALSQIPLYVLGAPLTVIVWISAVTAITGLLTHCNIQMHTGPLDWIFSTPRLHRWHHSKVLAEGNRNYGENLVLWDLLFGTYLNPTRRPPADIGINGRIARGFLAQLKQPFTREGVRSILGVQARAEAPQDIDMQT